VGLRDTPPLPHYGVPDGLSDVDWLCGNLTSGAGFHLDGVLRRLSLPLCVLGSHPSRLQRCRITPVYRSCSARSNIRVAADVNHLLHGTRLGLCSDHGLAAVGVVGDCGFRGRAPGVEQASPAEIQFCAGYALRLCGCLLVFPAEFDRLPCSQRATSRGARPNEIGTCLPTPPMLRNHLLR
jgi:hypothetical protein